MRLNGRTLKFWLPIAVVWTVYLLLVLWVYLNNPLGAGDYSYYYRGVQRLIDGRGLFHNLQGNDYVGPPLWVQLWAPFVRVLPGLRESSVVWYILNIIMFAGALTILSRHVSSRAGKAWLWVAPLLFVPTFQSFWLGQTTILLLLLTVGVWSAARERRPLLAGALLALASWMKFYPALFILYFAWKREWRLVITALIGIVLLIVFQIALSGSETFVTYFTDVLPTLAAEGQPHLNYANMSVLGFAQRLFSDNPQVIPLAESPLLLALTRYGLTALLLGVTAVLTARPTALAQTPPEKFDLEYALVMIVALLLGSTLGLHGMLSLVFAYVVLMLHVERYQRRRYTLWALVSMMLITVHFFIILGYLQPPSETELPALMLSLPFFGVMLAWGMLVSVALRRHKRSETVQPAAEPPSSSGNVS